MIREINPLTFRGRQLAATAYNATLGLLVGVTLTPMLFGLLGFLLISLLARGDICASTLVLCLLSALGWFFSWRSVRLAAMDAAKRYPISLHAVPIGMLAGALIAASVMYSQSGPSSVVVVFMMIAAGLMQARAAHLGSRQGVLDRHGVPVAGVGEMCAQCMYDLRATEEGKPCPECGGVMRYAMYHELGQK
jgi:hypothetical protein